MGLVSIIFAMLFAAAAFAATAFVFSVAGFAWGLGFVALGVLGARAIMSDVTDVTSIRPDEVNAAQRPLASD